MFSLRGGAGGPRGGPTSGAVARRACWRLAGVWSDDSNGSQDHCDNGVLMDRAVVNLTIAVTIPRVMRIFSFARVFKNAPRSPEPAAPAGRTVPPAAGTEPPSARSGRGAGGRGTAGRSPGRNQGWAGGGDAGVPEPRSRSELRSVAGARGRTIGSRREPSHPTNSLTLSPAPWLTLCLQTAGPRRAGRREEPGPGQEHFVPAGASRVSLTRVSCETLPPARAPSGLELSGEQVGTAARGWGAAGSRPWGRFGEATEARPAPRIWAPPPPGFAAGNGVLGGATPPSRSETKNTPGPDFPEPGREVGKWDAPKSSLHGTPQD
ncbi:hypothetical protein NN561_019016 [Cricetulus griseus]